MSYYRRLRTRVEELEKRVEVLEDQIKFARATVKTVYEMLYSSS